MLHTTEAFLTQHITIDAIYGKIGILGTVLPCIYHAFYELNYYKFLVSQGNGFIHFHYSCLTLINNTPC